MLEIFKRQPKKTPYEIGLTGTPEEFRAENTRAVKKRSRGSFGKYLRTKDQKELRRGAIQAFHEGRPENVQMILRNTEEFKICAGYVAEVYNSDNEKNVRKNVLSTLIKGSDNLQYVIKEAFLQDISADRRQQTLDDTLFSVLMKEIAGEEDFIAALLTAGAKADATTNGYKGFTLVQALEKNHSLSVIELLYKSGASFDDAIESMRIKGWDSSKIERMKFMREKFTGQPADEAAASIKALRQELAELREQLTAKQRSDATPAPATPEKSVQKHVLRRPTGPGNK